jgi:acyl CoA:acetate/3-ketoacid CoA transferase beta subunit
MPKNDADITPEEYMVVCMSRLVSDGEIVAQGLATPLVAAAYLLARYTHAPNLYFASAIGQGVCRDPAPLGLTRVESLWLDRSLTNIGFVRAVADVLPVLKPKEFFRPGQVDAQGNFNNIAFGQDYRAPRMRMPGTGGIPDVTIVSHDVYLYVPRHSRVTFVDKLDFLSGLGYHPARKFGQGPQFLVSDLGLFDYAHEKMRLVSYHPGTTIEQIRAKTGFLLDVAPDVQPTPAPSSTELRLLREEIDPLGIRNLESLGGAGRRELMQWIIAIENSREPINL